MTEFVAPGVLVFVCQNGVDDDAGLPRQWRQSDSLVAVHKVPCSGKIDPQYMMHAIEGGALGLCIVACSKGKCRLAQGNYRAQIRVETVKRVLSEIDIKPERIETLHANQGETVEQLHDRIEEAVQRICDLGPSPIQLEQKKRSAAS